ncbi:MAG: hypothetical protein ABFC94_06600, partial [Syntrophomonas sp.]
MSKNNALKYSALIIAMVFILLGVIPDGMSSAANTDTVTIRNIYQSFVRTSKVITIDDQRIGSFTDKKLFVDIGEGFTNVKSLESYGNQIVQAVLDNSWDITQALVSDGGSSSEVRYTGINENTPKITSIETPEVGVNEDIVVNGPDNLYVIADNTEYSIRVGSVDADAKPIVGHNNQIKLVAKGGASFAQGAQDITITRTVVIGTGADIYTLQNIFVYKQAVKVVGELNLDGITMFPTMGDPGSEVKFTRDNLQECDIYFISDINKPSLYVESNRA